MAIGTADITRPVDAPAAETRPLTETAKDTPDPITSVLDLYTKRTQAYEDVFGTPEQQRAEIATAKQREAATAADAETVYQGAVVPALVRQMQAARAPLPDVPKPIPEPPVPSQKARAFLDVGEKNALSGLVTGLGLMAQLAMAGKSPVGALGALTGAMNGWREGDTDRANREWRQYLGQVDQIRQENKTNLATFEAAMQKHGANIQSTQAEVIAALYGAGHYQAAAKVARDGVVQAYGNAQESLQHADKLFTDTVKLIEIMENRKLRMEMEKTRLAEQERWHTGMMQQREEDRLSREAIADQAHKDRVMNYNLRRERMAGEEAGEGFTAEALELAAQQYYATGSLPPLGMGKASTIARQKIMNRAGDLASSAGTTGTDFVARTQFAKASQTELSTLLRQRGQLMAFAQTADQNLDAALDLSKKMDAKGVPVINRWIL